MSIEDTLAERGDRYGSFEHHATIAQELQDTMRAQGGWCRLAPDQKQALTVIADKIARMLNGDPDYRDNWHDIVGYAKLVDDRMARAELANLAPQPGKPYMGVPHASAVGIPTAAAVQSGNCFVQGCQNQAGKFGACKVHFPGEERATHRGGGGSKFKQNEDGRWMQWGLDSWFFHSDDPNAVPKGLKQLPSPPAYDGHD